MKARTVHVAPDTVTAVTVFAFMAAMWSAVFALDRIADALERAHPAPAASK